MRLTNVSITLAASIGCAGLAGAQVSGRPVPEMNIFDGAMQGFMAAHEIEAGVLGISYDGNIVYLRGFGYIDDDIELPENALWRLASCTKPITAAGIRRAEDQGFFNVGDRAFNVSGNGGVLTVTPFGGLGDNRIANITIDHLLNHEGGWDDDVDDHTYKEREIADDMGVASPPGRTRTMNWILGEPLMHAPGSDYYYNNAGYLALGLILTQETGGYLAYIRNNVLTPGLWVPETEVIQARTFEDWGSPREPWYRNSPIVWSVFDSRPGFVERAYGGVDLEARLGQGGLCVSAAAMLTFAQNYRVSYSGRDIGEPLSAFPLGDDEALVHNGSQNGVNTYLRQFEQDGHQINVFIAFNHRPGDVGGSGHYGTMCYNDFIGPTLESGSGFTWPSTTSDGFWTLPGVELPLGRGAYEAPFIGFGTMLANCESGSRIRLQSADSAWTGTITKRLWIDAPLGAATIGVQ